MLFVNQFIKNYEEFKSLKEKTSSRYVKILCEYIVKNRIWDGYVNWNGDFFLLRRDFSKKLHSLMGIMVENIPLYIEGMELDPDDIVPHDGDVRCVRYYNPDREAHFKRKVGKVINAMIEKYNSMDTYHKITPKLQTYLCESFSEKWSEYANNNNPNQYRLKVDDDFEFIYDSDNYAGHIGSCQSNGNNFNFYKLVDGAKACSIVDENDKIFARCILFTKVNSNIGKISLAERQYAVNNRMIYKSTLIRLLRKEYNIDAYKNYDAGAYDETAFSAFDEVGEINFCDLTVPLVRALEDKDPVSWQDTFYMYNGGSQYLSNSCGEFELRNSSHNVTYANICHRGYYDEYLEDYIDDAEDEFYVVNYQGNEITVHYRTRENYFRYVADEGEYYHEEEVTYLEDRDEYVLNDNAVYCVSNDYYIHIDDAVELPSGSYCHRETAVGDIISHLRA